MPLLTVTADTDFWGKLSKTADAQYGARRREIARAGFTGEAILARQAEVRECYLRLLGALPEKTPLNPVVTGIIERGDFRIEKVAFESRPNFHVTANLYLPTGDGPRRPGILVPSGHEDAAKAVEAYQKVCISLVRNGFVAMAFDPIGQGERHPFLTAAGEPETRGGTTDHTLLDIGAKLNGSTFVAYALWDGIRAVDYLEARPEVDAARIGCTGNSGGGGQTIFLSAFDERISVAAPCCCVMTMERKIQTMFACDGCQHLAGEGALGLELADYLSLRAPRPLIILAAERDNFEFASTREVHAEVQKVYEGLGHGDRVAFFSWDDGHGFSQPRREAAVRWMRRWFMDDDGPVEERGAEVFSREALNVTASGETATFFPGEVTVRDLNTRRARELCLDRKQRRQGGNEKSWLNDVKTRLGITSVSVQPEFLNVEGCAHEYYHFLRGYLTRSDALALPLLIFESHLPVSGKGRPACIIADEKGKETCNPPEGIWSERLREGAIVVAVDLHGFGETADDPVKNKDKFWNREHRTSVISMHIGKPLPGLRAEDLLAVVDYLASRDDVDPGRINLTVLGDAGPPGIYAAALDGRIADLTVAGSIASLQEVVENPLRRGMLPHVVPFALEVFDLPELVEAIAPRVVRTRGGK